jgi:hypothetical protein
MEFEQNRALNDDSLKLGASEEGQKLRVKADFKPEIYFIG